MTTHSTAPTLKLFERPTLSYLYWENAGDENDRTLVFIHGLNGDAHNWDPIVGRMAWPGTIIAPDLRGHGRSSWTLDGYWIRDFANDVIGLLNGLRIEGADLVGHSLGARIAIGVAGLIPDRIRSVTLSDMGPEISRSAAEEVRNRAGNLAGKKGYRTRSETLEYLQAMYPDWKPEFRESLLEHGYRRNWADRFVRVSDPDLSWSTGSAGSREVQWMWSLCDRITAPTLIVRGEHSYILDEALAAEMMERISNARLHELATGHYVPFEDPDGFTSVLQGFLAEV